MTRRDTIAEQGEHTPQTQQHGSVAVDPAHDEDPRTSDRPGRPLWRAIQAFREVHDLSQEDLSTAFDDLR